MSSRISARIAGVAIMISDASTRPSPSCGYERLTEDRLQREGEHRPDLLLLVCGEHVDDAVHGLDGTDVCNVPNVR